MNALLNGVKSKSADWFPTELGLRWNCASVYGICPTDELQDASPLTMEERARASVEACGLQHGFFRHPFTFTHRSVLFHLCVALNYQPDPKSLQNPHNSDICRTKCMCGMNHSTIRGGITLRSPEARMKRRSNQSNTRLRVCKTRMKQNTRTACGGQQSRLIRWISSWPLTLSDGGGDTYKQVASPGPPPLRSRKYHQGAVS